MFGKKLQVLRKAKSLSQEDLAEKLLVSRQAISKWESGQALPELDKLISMSRLFSVTLDELVMADEKTKRINIIGSGEVSAAKETHFSPKEIQQGNQAFWSQTVPEQLGEIALPFWGVYVSEEKHQLLGQISGKSVLEIGCGAGGSLKYMGEQGAEELWGVDISQVQLEKAEQRLAEQNLFAKLICSSMEVGEAGKAESGLPQNYFDLIYSVYAIGWATDLTATFLRIASYLKEDGLFIFSWSHPFHKCVALDNQQLIFKKSYFDESWYSVSLDKTGREFVLSDRKLSTYLNSLVKAGFVIEELIEASDEELLDQSDFAQKAKMLPVTFVIKARKKKL